MPAAQLRIERIDGIFGCHFQLEMHDFMAASLDELRQYSEEPQFGGM
jgi:hypothetical protein